MNNLAQLSSIFKQATLWLALSMICMSSPISAQLAGVNYDWELKRDKDGIRIYTSAVSGSKYRAVRAVTSAKTNVSSAVALILDVDACPDWAELCERSEELKLLSPTSAYVYTLNNLPFPVKDRDVVALVNWDHDTSSGRVSMTSVATNEDLVPQGKAIRLQQAVAQWHFTPLENGSIQIENFAHIDPNGVTPAWITNMLLVDSPFKTLVRMREILESGQYGDKRVPFLEQAIP